MSPEPFCGFSHAQAAVLGGCLFNRLCYSKQNSIIKMGQSMKQLTGILLIAISAASFGTLAIFSKFLYRDGLDIFTILFLRFGIAALLMLVILLVRREKFPRGKILLQLIGMGALGYVGQSFSYLTAIKYASAGLVALLLYLYPMFVFILSVIVLHEKATWIKIVAILIALIGTALTVDPAGGQLSGILLAIAAALIYSIYIIVGTNVMKHVSAVQSSVIIFASAGTVYGILMSFNGMHLPSTDSGWVNILGIVLIATVIPVVTFLAGLERIGPTNAAMLSTLEPVVTVLLAAWIFGERLQSIALFGGGMILIAVIMLTRGEASEIKEPAQKGSLS
jgi:drug/metabolite transporter (DMT)-like permease